MFWQDLLLTRWVDEDELASVLGTVFRISPQAVTVVDDLEDVLTRMPPSAKLLVQRTVMHGDVKMQLSVFVRDPQLQRQVTGLDATLKRVKRVCALLHADALLSDESISHSTWLRVRPTGVVERVMLDPDRLDRDDYVIASATPLLQRRRSAMAALP